MTAITTVTANPAIDTTATAEHVVADRKLRCTDVSHEPGGGGINVARAIARLGGTAAAIHTQGGENGNRLSRLLDGEGLKHAPLPVEGETRENVTVYEDATGRQFRFVMPGPKMTEDESKRLLAAVEESCRRCEYLVASGSLPPGTDAHLYARMASVARDNDTSFILDASGKALKAALEEGVYLVKPNLREVAELAGCDIGDEPCVRDHVRQAIGEGQAEIFVVSLGAGGVLLATREGVSQMSAPTVPVKSKVGAGDSMVAGIVWGLAQGKDVSDAVRYGIASGAAAAMTPGTELCRAAETNRLYKQSVKEFNEERQSTTPH